MTDDTPETGADDLDATVKRADPDRWAAARFVADAQARADLVTLYALDHVLSRVAQAARQPMLAEIRMAWWREALQEAFAGQDPRAHPVLDAYVELHRRRGLPDAPVLALVEGRARDLDPAPFADRAELEAWLDDAWGSVATLAAAILGGGEGTAGAARAWGLGRLVRTAPERLPEGFDPVAAVDGWLGAARAETRTLPVAAFPAIAYATLAKAYVRDRAVADWARTLRLTWASATGRL